MARCTISVCEWTDASGKALRKVFDTLEEADGYAEALRQQGYAAVTWCMAG